MDDRPSGGPTRRSYLSLLAGTGAGCLGDASDTDATSSATRTTATGTSGPADRADYRTRIERYRERADSDPALAYYFDRRLGIIDRLREAIATDESASIQFHVDDATMQRHQLAVFEETLREDLDRLERNRGYDFEAPANTVDVRDLGASGDGDEDDHAALTEAVERARERGPGTRIYLPAGTYAISSGWHVFDLRDVLIQGEPGTTIVGQNMGVPDDVDGFTQLTNVARCENVRFENLSFDLDPLPFTQGTITAVDASTRSIEVAVDEGFEPPTAEYYRVARLPRVLVRDPETNELVEAVSEHLMIDSDRIHPKLDPVSDLDSFGVRALDGDDRYRLQLNHNGGLSAIEERIERIEPGQRFVLLARAAGNHAIHLWRSAYTTFENVDVHASFRYAFWEHASNTGTKLIDANVAPPADSGRYQSGNADGINARESTVGPYLKGCTIRANGDDAINFHPNCYPVTAVNESDRTKLRVAERHATNELTFRPGDTVAFVAEEPPEIVSFRTIEDAAPTGDAFGDGPIELTVETPVESVAAGHLVINSADTTGGFVVADCTMEHNRARTAQFYTTDGVIENNTFDGEVAFKSVWNREKGYPVRNVLARNNAVPKTDWWHRVGPGPQRELMRRLWMRENAVRS
jgi:hypothetical protein